MDAEIIKATTQIKKSVDIILLINIIGSGTNDFLNESFTPDGKRGGGAVG